MKLTKKRYLIGFTVVVVLLWGVRTAFPQIAEARNVEGETTVVEADSMAVESDAPVVAAVANVSQLKTDKKHKIYSVPSFKTCFPDTQSVQLAAAMKWGVKRVKNRDDAEKRKSELVYVGANPYVHIDKLYSSIPYLVPRAAVLLQDIGQAFFDSLYVKGINLHRPIVTSVLRTEADVTKLRRHNGNATENSCHLYGTTFDICYNRYETVQAPDGPERRAVRNDSLKYVLCEVLRDMREQGRCYIKYEVKQGCFHMTVR
jgi:uncharacterized protein YcbK (DUF882 family)